MRAACAIVVFLGACGSDPVLDVVVKHPAGADIASTTITVYVSDTLSCDDVRFGDVDATTLAGLQVTEETLFDTGRTDGGLANIPRLAHKVIVGRGFGNDGKLTAGGCVEQDAVTGDLTLEIDTELAVIAAVTPNPGSDGKDSYGVDVTIATPSGDLVAGRAVSWRVYAPIGTVPAATGAASVGDPLDAVWERATLTCSDASGVANVHPIPPDLTGGYEVRPRIAWTQDPVSAVSALTKLDLGLGAGTRVSLSGGAPHPCAIGHVAGLTPERVGACINGANVDVFDVSVSAAGAEAFVDQPGKVVTNPAAVFGLPEANGTDVDVLAIQATPGNAKVVSVYGKNPGGACLACTGIDDVQVVPACEGGPAATVLAHLGSGIGAGTIVRLAADWSPSLFAAAEPGYTTSFNAAGCMTRLDIATGTPTTVQAVVLDFTATTDTALPPFSRMLYDCTTKCAKLDLPVPTAGAGFAPGTTQSLIATTVDATGVELGQFVMISGSNGGTRADHLVPLSSIPSVAIPHRIVTGQFDKDGQLDLVWDNVAGRRPLIQIGYARLGPDGPLSAFGASPGDIADLIVGDLTSDGLDDILVAGTNIISVIPTRVPARTGEIRADATVTCP